MPVFLSMQDRLSFSAMAVLLWIEVAFFATQEG
jgi:hypothetical protein